MSAAPTSSPASVPPKGSLAPLVAAWRVPYKPGPLTEAELEQYWTLGYVVKHGLLKVDSEIEPSRVALGRFVDDIARRLHAAGLIADLCEGAPFETRMIEIEKQFPHASVLLHKMGILPPEIAALWGGDTLMACARQLLGDETDIAAHPVWNIRVKTPSQEEAVVPWHQDTGYLHPRSRGVHQPTAWVPLVPAVAENGCMQVVSGGHRAGVECKHECCIGGTWYVQIADGELAAIGADAPGDVVTCECPLGSVLFINSLIPHRSIANTSKGIRWSLDLRWQRADEDNGFWGLKDSLLMSKAKDASFKPDWASWAAVDRNEAQLAAAIASPHVAAEIAKALSLDAPSATGMLAPAAAGAGAGAEEAKEGEAKVAEGGAHAAPPGAFDTVIAGPWMGRWNIVHHNRHVNQFTADKASGAGTSWHSGTVAF